MSASPMRSIFPTTKAPKILSKSKKTTKKGPQEGKQTTTPKSKPAPTKKPVAKKAPIKKQSSKMPNDKVSKGKQFVGLSPTDTSNAPAVDLTNLG